MLLAFRQYNGGPAFFHSHEHIIDDLLVALFIGDQQAVESLDCYPGSCINTLLFFEETVLYKGIAGCDKCVAGLHP